MINKHEKVLDYLRQYPESPMFFNINVYEDNNISVNTVANENIVKEYIDGTKEKQYDFAMVFINSFSAVPYSNENTEYIFNAEQFMEWIDEQEQLKNYPDFGENCFNYHISNLQNMPAIAEQSEELTKYMFQIRITYTEQKERK